MQVTPMGEPKLDGETLDQMLSIILAQGISEETVRVLRASWPGVHFSLCQDDDVSGVDPVKSGPGLNLYLVDGRAHCLALTSDFEAATGLVVAEVADDEV